MSKSKSNGWLGMFSNRANSIKRQTSRNAQAESSATIQSRVSAYEYITPRNVERIGIASSTSSFSVVDQYHYLQEQHLKLQAKHRALKENYSTLEQQHNRLMVEHYTLKEQFKEFEEQSQKSFTGSKLLVLLKLKRRDSKGSLQKRNIIKNEACFDTYLQDVIKVDHLGIPRVLHECVTALEGNAKFMQSPGLYRMSGNHNVIQNLRYDINDDNYRKLHKLKSPHEICGIVKLFLRELKEPLVTLEVLNRIIPSIQEFTPDKRLKVRQLYNALDNLRKATLKYLIRHLKKVVETKQNEVEVTSLGLLMSSCIFNETLADICPVGFEEKSIIPRECIIMMITDYDAIFEQ